MSENSEGNTFFSEGAPPAAAPPPPHVDNDRHADDSQPFDLDQPGGAKTAADVLVSEADRERPSVDDTEPVLPPIERPRSMSKAEAEHWDGLPRSVQEFVSRREADHDRWFAKHQSETAAAQKQVEAERASIQQARDSYAENLRHAAHALVPELVQFADIRTEGDLAQLMQVDPERAQKFAELAQRAEYLKTQGALLEADQRRQQSEHEQQQQQQLQQWFQDQDSEFIRQHQEEFANPARADELRRDVQEYLTKEIGLSPQELSQLAQNPLVRGAKTQRILLAAAMWNKAQKAGKAARPVAPPRPFSPGLSRGNQGAADSVASAAARNDMSSFIKLRNQGRNR